MDRGRLARALVVAMALAAGGAGYLMASGDSPSPPPPATRPAAPLAIDLGSQVTMKLALIPSGKFLMGSPADEAGRARDQVPQREVTISRPFYLGAYEVTQRQYEQVMGPHRSRHKGPDNPVDSVAWDQAAEFCRKLSDLARRTVRLPTEAEWEYACRAGTTTPFHFGDDEKDLDQYAWHKANSARKTHPVGTKKPNRFGLYDMQGNIWEWCADFHAPYDPNDKADPTGPAAGKHRVVRGSAYVGRPTTFRSAARFRAPANCRACHMGFRVAADADRPE